MKRKAEEYEIVKTRMTDDKRKNVMLVKNYGSYAVNILDAVDPALDKRGKNYLKSQAEEIFEREFAKLNDEVK